MFDLSAETLGLMAIAGSAIDLAFAIAVGLWLSGKRGQGLPTIIKPADLRENYPAPGF